MSPWMSFALLVFCTSAFHVSTAHGVRLDIHRRQTHYGTGIPRLLRYDKRGSMRRWFRHIPTHLSTYLPYLTLPT
ncbi:hypothetical protein F4861DRAFT_386655 [Xylaria intraflava]|nr:hypothetical protein F4861DRAFT_386655 [Xylaria intraflava]